MVRTLLDSWWAPVVRGVLAICFGLYALAMPLAAINAFVYGFGLYALADGLVQTTVLMQGEDRSHGWSALTSGALASVVAGLAAFTFPGITSLALLFLVASRAVLTGAMELAAAYKLRTRLPGAGSLAAGGLLSIVAGMAMFLVPGAGAIALAWLIGAYAFGFGLLGLALGNALRTAPRVTVTPLVATPATARSPLPAPPPGPPRS